MSEETESLRDLYLDVAGGEMLTEPQEESPSHKPLRESETDIERSVSAAAHQDGLADAVE